MELEGKVLVVKRIHVVYRLAAPPEARETVERVHAVHKDSCPIYRSIGPCIAMTTEVRLEALSA